MDPRRAQPDDAISTTIPRALWVLVCCVVGVLVSTWVGDGVAVYLWWLGACSCALCGFVMRRGAVWAVLAIGLVCAMAGWTRVRTDLVPGDWMGLWLDDVRQTGVRVEGVVSERPQIGWTQEGEFAPFTFNARMTRFTLEARSVVRGDATRVPASGRLRVRVRDEIDSLRVGDVVEVRGMARGVGRARNPGDEMERVRALHDGVAGVVEVPASSLVERRGVDGSLWWRVARARSGLIERAMRVIEGVEGDAGVLLGALMLGERGEGYTELSGTYVRAGVAHLLAISGLHLGFVVLLLLGVARVLGGGSRWEWIAVCVCLGVYVWLMPARVPIVRACVMAMVVLVGWGFGRRYRMGSVLSWAGVAVVVWRPLDVFEAGMQLSFGVVAGLVVLLGWWDRFRSTRSVGGEDAGPGAWLRRRAGEIVVVSVGAQLVSIPLTWTHFGQVHLWGALAALTLTLVFGVLMMVGMVGVVVAMAVPASTGAVASVLGAMADWVNGVVEWFAGMPGASVSMMEVSVWWSWCVLACGWWLIARRGVGRVEVWVRRVAVVVGVCWCGVQVASGLRNGIGQSVLVMDTLDVGDGTCHVIRTRDRVLVWDAGSGAVGRGRRLVRAMRNAGVWRVDTLVLTHANLDHYSLVDDVREAFGIGQVVTTEALSRVLEERDGAIRVLGRVLEGLDVRVVSAGERIEMGSGVEMEVVSPARGVVFEDVNDSSMVALVRVGEGASARRVLLTGDIEDEGVARVRERLGGMGVGGVDVMELPHHGSVRARAMELVEWLDPGVVVQSTGESRAWDTRWDGVRAGRRWRSTAEVGATRVTISSDGALGVASVRD